MQKSWKDTNQTEGKGSIFTLFIIVSLVMMMGGGRERGREPLIPTDVNRKEAGIIIPFQEKACKALGC